MLTQKDQILVLTMIEQALSPYISEIKDQAAVHLGFHKQLTERINKLEKRLENSENQDTSKT